MPRVGYFYSMIKGIFRNYSFLVLVTLTFLASCGPSLEEKARKIALRDSASIDSALKKEEAAKRVVLHRQKQLKDSIKRLVQDSLKHKTDSLKAKVLTSDSTANTRVKLVDTNHNRRHYNSDTGRQHKTDTGRYHKNHHLTKNNTSVKPLRFDSALFYKEQHLHKRNAVDSLHKRKPRKISLQTDTSIN